MLSSIDHKVAEGLALNSLEVINFRAFERLSIPNLAKVNLITGKNNVGKSALLEAIELYASFISPMTLQKLLVSRDELPTAWMRSRNPGARIAFQPSHPVEQALQNLFYNRPLVDGYQSPFLLGPLGKLLTVNVEWFDMVALHDAEENYELRPIAEAQLDRAHDPDLYVTVRQGSSIPVRQYILGRILSKDIPNDKGMRRSEYITPHGVQDEKIGTMWDAVVATSAEGTVLEALRILHPSIERLVFVAEEGGSGQRVPLVKSTEGERAPLRSFGEGMSRVLGIILGLTTVGNGGVLLIDEIESGLHYSVMPDFWRLIRKVAEQLNVQVFATTHSWECIEAFQHSTTSASSEGILIRLDRRQGLVAPTIFDERRLAIATRDQIEVR
ncbi:MAG: AAA family ATPase [Capsulimonas sp.]|uniref:AAA family ATPase n=1 Tax=Capsulimonas sp. TaxID=2494211 RepID=UPI003266E32B